MAQEALLWPFFTTVDLATDPDWDVADPRTFHRLSEAIEEGLVDAVLGGPPCATWSRARFLPTPGPRPVRTRGEHAWGMPGLSAAEQERVDESDVLTINCLAMMEGCSSRGGCGGCHLLGHPEDPGVDPLPSMWDTEEVIEWERRTSSVRVSFDQCMYGGPTKKPTCVSSNLDGIEAFDENRCDGDHHHERSVGVRRGVHMTRRLQAYPSQLCSAMASLVVSTLLRFEASGAGPTGWMRSSTAAVRVSSWSTRTSAASPLATVVLNESAARGRASIAEKGQTALHVHVDDGVVLAERGTGLADELMQGMSESLEAAGFDVPDRQRDGDLARIVGYEPERTCSTAPSCESWSSSSRLLTAPGIAGSGGC